MFLSDSMRELVLSIRASKKSRKGFVNGMRQNTKAMQQENRNFLKGIHDSNKARSQELFAFLDSAKQERLANYHATKESIKRSLDAVKQSVSSIRQNSMEFVREMRKDAVLARTYWAMIDSDEPLPEPEPYQPTPPPRAKATSTATATSPTNKSETTPASKSATAPVAKEPFTEATTNPKPTEITAKPPTPEENQTDTSTQIDSFKCNKCQFALVKKDMPCPQCSEKKKGKK
jgi:hypothetical protein